MEEQSKIKSAEEWQTQGGLDFKKIAEKLRENFPALNTPAEEIVNCLFLNNVLNQPLSVPIQQDKIRDLLEAKFGKFNLSHPVMDLDWEDIIEAINELVSVPVLAENKICESDLLKRAATLIGKIPESYNSMYDDATDWLNEYENLEVVLPISDEEKSNNNMKFRKKEVIEAVQFDGNNLIPLTELMQSNQYNNNQIAIFSGENNDWYVRTLTTDKQICKYDWLVKMPKGNFEVYKLDIFNEIFEPSSQPINTISDEPDYKTLYEREVEIVDHMKEVEKEYLTEIERLKNPVLISDEDIEKEAQKELGSGYENYELVKTAWIAGAKYILKQPIVKG